MNIGLSEITKRAVEQLPSSAQWMRLPQVLSRREGRTLVVLTLFFAASFFALALSFYLKNTESVPAAGGRIIEGVAGSPRFLNPVYADTSDADRDLVNVLFSGLLSSDREGKLTPDLAEEFIVGDGGRSVEIRLRDNIYWHDGVPITADDVVFTIKVLSDASYKSPVRANWVGVTAEKLSERVVLFKLQEPYAGFFERLTVKIIPQHIWENIAPENFALSSYNLQAVGSGPYKIEKISQDSSGAVSEIRLKANLNYHKHAPYIQSLIFRFYANEEELAGAVRRGQVTSFAISSPDLAEPTERSNLQRLSLRLPRYFALFFNLREQPLSNKKIREALAYATNSEELVNTLFETYAREVNSPMLPDVFALKDPGISYDYDPALATNILNSQGYQLRDGSFAKVETPQQITSELRQGNQGSQVRLLQECLAQDPQVYSLGTVNGVFGPSTLAAVKAFQEKYKSEILTPNNISSPTGTVGPSTAEKLNALCYSGETGSTKLALQITTTTKLQTVGEAIAQQWKSFGITTEVRTLSPLELEHQVITNRKFEVLLFGEVLTAIPDPFPFWHSSQERSPGLNLSGYESATADQLLIKIRKEQNEETRKGLMENLQDQILEDLPALILYDTDYLYSIPKGIKGGPKEDALITGPSSRFAEIEEWYIKTQRRWTLFQ